MSVKFWKELELCKVLVCRSSLPASDVTGELVSLSRFLSAVSTRPDVVTCSGCQVDFAKTIDQSVYFSQGVQSCFHFEQLSLAKLMHKTSYSVFGQIDFFSVLQSLMVSLGGSLTEDWMLRSPTLTKVCTIEVVHFNMEGKRGGLVVLVIQCSYSEFYRPCLPASMTCQLSPSCAESLSANGNGWCVS